MRAPRLAVLFVSVVASIGSSACKGEAPASSGTLRVAGASDLADAFKDMGDAFTKQTGTPVTFTFAATGLLAKQIAEGAPYDVFAAANASFVDDVVKSGACFGDSQAKYATGRLTIWTKEGGPAVQSLADLATRADVVHVAIANPDHAPYGKAAKEALEKSGAWSAIEKKVVYGENVQQTLQFAQSGNAEVAIVSRSLAMRSGGHAIDVDPSLHAPIEQAVVACKGSAEGQGRMQPVARAFATFVAGDEGRAVLAKYGFGPPPAAH